MVDESGGALKTRDLVDADSDQRWRTASSPLGNPPLLRLGIMQPARPPRPPFEAVKWVKLSTCPVAQSEELSLSLPALCLLFLLFVGLSSSDLKG